MMLFTCMIVPTNDHVCVSCRREVQRFESGVQLALFYVCYHGSQGGAENGHFISISEYTE